MRRRSALIAIASMATHHALEDAGGVGLPGEPVLGPDRARVLWTVLMATHAVAGRLGGPRWNPVLAIANGVYSAVALQHYTAWPVRIRYGLPVLTEAEGISARLMPVYNAALIGVVAASTVSSARECGPSAWRHHLLGLATLPLVAASARHHLRWLADGGRPRGSRPR
jgi:hypothetical protein